MKIKSIHLTNFRNYSDQIIKFNKRITFITGKNAFGKTNIIEAISLLSTGKSFRGASDNDILKEKTNLYTVRAEYERSNQNFRIDYGYEIVNRNTNRKILINKKPISGRSSLIGNIVCVIFSPSDISIIEGGPQIRRKFFDMMISSSNKAYLNELIQYNKILLQRNAELKRLKQNFSSDKSLSIWDVSIAESAQNIIRYRKEYISSFNEIFKQSLSLISNDYDDIYIKYNIINNLEENNFIEALEKSKARDLALGYTTVGPHRHVIRFENNGKDIENFGSQGQKRSLVLALKISEYKFLKIKMGFSPILLIDDVIRELDVDRRSAFIRLLGECNQAIFTTPDINGLEDFIKTIEKDVVIYTLKQPGKLDFENNE